MDPRLLHQLQLPDEPDPPDLPLVAPRRQQPAPLVVRLHPLHPDREVPLPVDLVRGLPLPLERPMHAAVRPGGDHRRVHQRLLHRETRPPPPVPVVLIDRHRRVPVGPVPDHEVDHRAQLLRVPVGLGPQQPRIPEAVQLVPVVVVGREVLRAAQCRIRDAVPVLDAPHAGVGRDAGVALRHLEIHHGVHAELLPLVGDRLHHVRIVPRALRHLDAVGPRGLELAHHRPCLAGGVADVPFAERLRPAQAEHEPGAHHAVGSDLRALLGHPRHAGAGARIAHRRYAVPQVDAIDEVERLRAEVAAGRRRVLEALSPTPVEVDEIIRRCQLSAPVVQAVLLELELAGRLSRYPGSRVALEPT
ncbi:MAG: hypothetical protein HUU26_02395 [Gemmatimonadaceae bacterium]|nr:hypothetical protein [Gemmatimonadaceae bacterium]